LATLRSSYTPVPVCVETDMLSLPDVVDGASSQ
jgi:hypothetical protein